MANDVPGCRSLKAYYPAILPNLTCALGMAAGYIVDQWRSPVWMPPMNTGSKGISAELLQHVQAMPTAHIGMGIGGVFCVFWHLGRRASEPVAFVLALLWTFGGMLVAEAGALTIPAQLGTGALMAVMAVFMIALGCIPLPKGLRSVKANLDQRDV